MTQVAITLPDLHPAQQKILREASRFNVIDCGRRFGKTLMGIDLAVDPYLLEGYPVGWFSPTYKMMLEVWREVTHILQPITERRNAQERRIELITGGVLEMWSMDDENAGRGRRYARIIADEAAMVTHLLDAWNAAIRPTLTDYQGDAWFLSTPKGRNAFWRMFQWGQDPANGEWMSWQMPTSANPYIAPLEIEAARQELPASIFAQEYLAEFMDNAGLVFRNVRNCIASPPAHPDHGARYVMGVDWAQSQDFTVLVVMDANNRQVVAVDRFNQIGWDVQRGRLAALAHRWQVSTILAEHNSIGGPNIEQLQTEGLPVKGFTTTNDSKQAIMVALQLAFEQGTIAIPNDPVMISELEAFEAIRLPSGRWRYEAPQGMHDDTVIALALALEAANRPAGMRVIRQSTNLYGSRQRAGQRGKARMYGSRR